VRMDRHDISELQSQRDYPCVSLFLPVFPGSAPDRQQTSVRLKNLLRETEARLLQEMGRRDVAVVLEKLESLVAGIDAGLHTGGWALFANPSYSRSFALPFAPEERITINHSFVARDLIFAVSRCPEYHVLSLTENSARLFRGESQTLQELQDGPFPVALQIPGVQTELPGGYGIETTEVHNGSEREFLQRVQRALAEVPAVGPAPLILAGVERTLGYFDEVLSNSLKNKLEIVGRLHGNFGNVPLHTLGDRAWALVQDSQISGREKARFRLEEAIGPGRAALGLESVWHEAKKGRVDTLLVEEGFHQEAVMKDNGLPNGRLEINILPDAAKNRLLADAVDETVNVVLQARGTVVFLPPGQLTSRGRIAAILRY